MKIIIIAFVISITIGCSKNNGNPEPPFQPFTLQKCMTEFGLQYGVYYNCYDKGTTNLRSKLKINSDTSIVELYNGVEYSYYYSFASNNSANGTPLTVTFKAKNKSLIPLTPTLPVSAMAKHQYFQIRKEVGILKVSGNYSYADPSGGWKFNLSN